MAQFFTAYQINQGIRGAQQRLTAKANGDQVFDLIVRETTQLLCLSDNRREVVAFEVADAGPADDAAVQMRLS